MNKFDPLFYFGVMFVICFNICTIPKIGTKRKIFPTIQCICGCLYSSMHSIIIVNISNTSFH